MIKSKFMDCLVPEDDPADFLHDLWRECELEDDPFEPDDFGDFVYDMDGDEV